MVAPIDLNVLMETIHFSGTVEGRKRLQKTICVLKHRDGLPLGFEFIPYYYGPYSEELADSIQSLIGAGYVNEEANEFMPGVYQYNYSLTERGRQAIESILTEQRPLYDRTPQQIQNLMDQINAMELDELVRLSKTLNLENPP